MKTGGFITLHRQILDWEWYQNTNTFRLFVHCLLMANFTDGRFEGKEIKRGQFVTSIPSLSSQTMLSAQQVRTALDHLKSTGEITDKSYAKYRIITVVKYDEYQNDNRQSGVQITANQQANNSQSTGYQQAINRQVTGNQQQYNNNNNNNKETKEQGNNNKREGSAQRFTPPTREEVDIFCRENGLVIDVDYFIDYYNGNGWMAGKNKMKDWEATVRNWARRENRGSVPQQKQQKVLPAQDFQQRSYEGVDDEILSNLSKEMAIFKATGEVKA